MRIIILSLVLLVLLSAIWVSLGSGSEILIEWLGYRIEISTIFATIVILLTIITIFSVMYFLIFLKNIPGSLKKYYQEKQEHDDMLLLINGFASLCSEDSDKIKNYLKKVNSNKNHSQMISLKQFVTLFNAQVNKLNLDEEEALEDAYLELLQYEETRIIGLKGLMNLRMRHKRYQDALIYAEKSALIQPKSPEILNNLFEIYTALGLYEKASNIINKRLDYKYLTKKEANALLVQNFLKFANHLIACSEAEQAITLLEKALKIDPSCYEVLVNLVRIYVQDHNKNLAYKIIEKAWKNKPSLDIGHLMVDVSRDEELNRRIKLLEKLVDWRSENQEGYLILAENYINENMLTQARATLDKLLSMHAPDFAASRLMALIEAKAHNNHSVIINWLNRI